jgi:hypothetical protein
MTTRVYAQSISAYHTYHTTGFYICEWPAYLLLTGTMSLQVLPGARVPADGEVVTGDSYVDEALITGEPLPVVKRPGDAVISGTVNGSGTFNMQATRVGANTTLNQVRVPSKVLPCIALFWQIFGAAKPCQLSRDLLGPVDCAAGGVSSDGQGTYPSTGRQDIILLCPNRYSIGDHCVAGMVSGR